MGELGSFIYGLLSLLVAVNWTQATSVVEHGTHGWNTDIVQPPTPSLTNLKSTTAFPLGWSLTVCTSLTRIFRTYTSPPAPSPLSPTPARDLAAPQPGCTCWWYDTMPSCLHTPSDSRSYSLASIFMYTVVVLCIPGM